MLCERRGWTRRRFLSGLSVLLGATAAAGCGPAGVGSVKLKNSGGKFKARTGKGAGTSRRRIPGPNDMKPADGGQ